jgi:hypothetical protein
LFAIVGALTAMTGIGEKLKYAVEAKKGGLAQSANMRFLIDQLMGDGVELWRKMGDGVRKAA